MGIYCDPFDCIGILHIRTYCAMHKWNTKAANVQDRHAERKGEREAERKNKKGHKPQKYPFSKLCQRWNQLSTQQQQKKNKIKRKNIVRLLGITYHWIHYTNIILGWCLDAFKWSFTHNSNHSTENGEHKGQKKRNLSCDRCCICNKRNRIREKNQNRWRRKKKQFRLFDEGIYDGEGDAKNEAEKKTENWHE